jgi:rare lipoprotein A
MALTLSSGPGLRRTLIFSSLALVFANCRTPPPLARTAPDLSHERVSEQKPAPRRVERARAEPLPVRKHEPAADRQREQQELRERYGARRALGTLRGEASYYGGKFAGRRTASGEVFDPSRYTAAHRTLPFGTVLRVTRLDTGGVVYVRVTDRGPFGKKRRILDLSEGAADLLDMRRRGIAEVRAEIVERGVAKPSRSKRRRSRSAR